VSKALPALAACAVGLTACCILWLATIWGMGTSPDSINYLLIAKAIEQPGDIWDVSTQWPPLYPLLLAGAEGIIGELLEGARLFHCFIFGLNTLLFYSLVSDRFAKNDAPALAGTVLFVFMPGMFSVHYMAWSEPLFISCILLYLQSFRAWQHSSSTHLLVAAAVFLSLGLLTRYAGIAFVGASCALLLLGRQPLPSLLYRCLWYGALAILPLLLFFMGKWLFSEAENFPRPFTVHWVDLPRLLAVFTVLSEWFMPRLLPQWLSVTMLAVVGVLVGSSLFRARVTLATDIVAQLLFICGFYLAFLFASISFFDYYTPIDNRTLNPVLVLLLASLVFSIRRMSDSFGLWARLSTLIVIVWAVLGVPTVLSTAAAASQNGSGYFSRTFRSQDILQYVAGTPLATVYSNSPETIEIYFSREAHPLPATYSPVEGKASEGAAGDYKALSSKIRGGEAVLVYFNHFAWRSYFPPLAYFEDQLSLPVLYRGKSGIVFGVSSASPEPG